MVAVAVRAAAAQVILVEMAPSASTVGAVSPPFVHSCGGDGATDMHEPGVVKSNVEVLCVKEPSCFR
jgi:hypothetical protein